MVNLVQHDLEFILKQIKISEAHANGTPLSEIYVDADGNIVDSDAPGAVLAISHPLAPYGLRTVDGSFNNMTEGREEWGASGEVFPQFTDPYWRNENDDSMMFGTPANPVWLTNNDYSPDAPPPGSPMLPPGTVVDADPRLISNLIIDQTLDNPAAVYAALVHAEVPSAQLTAAMAAIDAAYEPHKETFAAAATATAAANAANAAATTATQAYQTLLTTPGSTPEAIDAAFAALQDALAASLDAAQASVLANDLAEDAQTALDTVLESYGIEMEGNSLIIPNVSPDEGLSAPYNSWFTLFGQFFDHGLDLVKKGGNGTVYIPLAEDDPLYNPATPHSNFMAVTRVTTGEDAANVTTPWVDQNQTYTSHPSHQVFLREYELGADGKPVATGLLLEGDRGLATWGDVKEQARTMLGINLTDADVGMVPLIRTDAYGKFIPDPVTGFAQVIIGLGDDGIPNTADDEVVSGTPDTPASLVGALRTPNAFLDDIAHSAVPVINAGADNQLGTSDDILVQDADAVAGNPVAMNSRGQNLEYDNELLDAHYITGDGRGNENIGLSAVHHIFHSEHNRTIEQLKEKAIEANDLEFLNEWLLEPLDSLPATPAEIEALEWNGERLFQAARFTTEMQYQHLVFEEFGRKAQPDVDAFVFNPSTDINPAIFAEFAHVVYRFGHSMLREEVAAIDADGNDVGMDLFEAFLNPLAFGSETIDHDTAAGAIVRGMTNQVGNEIDEFVTHVLRNQLVGIPLDLAAINIARGRDTGIPPLNEARRQFKEAANGDSQLDPYTSWADFALNLKNPASIVNFIAAYGTHQSIVDAETVAEKRDAAMLLVFGPMDLDGDGIIEDAPADRMDFLNATNAYAGGKLGGLEDIDLWVGGLAEKKMAFGGMLGSTFSFIFELQMENLQNGDRFYYLARVQGLNLLNELENNSLAKMVLNNTDLGESGYALPGDIFSVPDQVIYVDKNVQDTFGYEDPTHDDPFLEAISSLVERVDTNGDGIAEYLRVNSLDHYLIQGTNDDDHIVAGGGDDSVWGRGGNDRIEAGYGVDKIHGGDGDDIITNSGTDIGEIDMLHGEGGNDVIHGGSGLALIFGNEGQDFVITGPDGKEVFGGTGNDFILGGEGGDFLLGNEGDDWLEGANGFDVISGDNSELFFNSTIIGHDVMFAGENEQDFDAESGDDIMVQGESVIRNEGMLGFDWAIHKGNSQNADSDLTKPIFTTDEQDILRDRFDAVEALSGWDNDDRLWGDNRGDVDGEGNEGNPDLAGAEGTMVGHELNQEGVARIAGLTDVLGDWHETATDIAFDDGNILLGGGGSDVIEGRGGNDIIDGDRWLNVRIRLTHEGEIYTTDGMDQQIYLQTDYVNGVVVEGAVAQFGGRTLDVLMVDGVFNPSQLSIVREVATADGEGDSDVAVFWDVRENYTITTAADGSTIVTHNFDDANRPPDVNVVSDGTDKLWNIEILRFADGDFTVTPPQLSLHGHDLGEYRDEFESNSYSNSDGETNWTSSWQEGSDTGVTSGAIRISNDELRFGENSSQGAATIQRTVNLANAETARLSYSVDVAGFDNNDGEQVRVLFSRDGGAPILLETIGQDSDGGLRSFDLTGPFGAGAYIRFETTRTDSGTEFVYIDNVTVDFTRPAVAPTVDYETTFTEDGQAVDIAAGPAIVEDGGEIVSARIVLTNAKADDELNVGDLPDGIEAEIDDSVAGQITVTLTGAASLAAYQSAIQAVTFNNTSENPDTEDRLIEVTVNDGLSDSNVAVARVNVTASNDAPNAVNDAVITNVESGSFVIPEWVLLANDSDPDSVMNITGGSETGSNFSISVAGSGDITVTHSTSQSRSFNYTVSDGSATDTASVTVTRDTNGINGNNSNNIIIGDNGSDDFDAGGGNDIVLAGAGNDTIIWNVGDGSDFADGGSNTGTGDTFEVNGNNSAEAFVVYARAEAEAAGFAGLKGATQIVVARNGVLVAELAGIEEIVINTAGGTDSVTMVGDFEPTDLSYNTVTIDGDEGDDTIDISSLTSAHRILFRSNGGNDTIVGTLRPQDVIELPAGTSLVDYEVSIDDESGMTTLASEDHSITFSASGGMPQFIDDGEAWDDEDEDNDQQDDDDQHEDDGDDAGSCGDDDAPVAETGTTGGGTPSADVLVGTTGGDFLNGLGGRDVMFGGDGNDNMLGGGGNDMMYGDAGMDRIFGDAGRDLINAGADTDTVYGGSGDDIIVAENGDGDDTYYGDDMAGGSGNDTLDMATITANTTVDLGTGFLSHGSAFSAMTGSDTLWGVENVVTGSGDDTITASAAVNVIDGGSGNDVFRFLSAADADGDTILGFQPGDRIDLSGIDANGGAGGSPSFTLVTGCGFTGPGELSVKHETREDGDYTIVSGNTSGNDTAEFRLNIKGNHQLTANDFDL